MRNYTPDEEQERHDYHSYLLRVWREDARGSVWRASLENAETRERISFASISDLLGFLDEEVFRAARTPKVRGPELAGR